MPVNTRLLRTTVMNQAKRQMLSSAKVAARIDYKVKKEQFIQEFESHPVSEEIASGPKAFSNYLTEAEGNLFSFLGFSSDQKPIASLKKFLKDNIKLLDNKTKIKKIEGDRVIFETPVEIPTMSDINDFVGSDSNTELKDWGGGRSFVKMLENGVPGLPNYLFSLVKKFKNSRSGVAIQAKHRLRSGSLGKISYLSVLIENLKKRISGSR